MTHYETLGVEQSATADEIRTAYRRKLRQAHPDRGGSQADAQRINSAYEALGTPEARAAYDRRLDMQRRGINVDAPHMAQPRQSTGTGTIPPEMWDLLAEVLLAQARAQAQAGGRAGAGRGTPYGAPRGSANPGFGVPGGMGGPGQPRIVFERGPFGPGAFGPGTFGPSDIFREPRKLSMNEVWLGGSAASRLRGAVFVLAMVSFIALGVISSVSSTNALLTSLLPAVMLWFAMSGSHRSVNAGLPTFRSILFLLYLGFSGLFGLVGLVFGLYAGALGIGFANLVLIALTAQTYVSFTFSRMREVMRDRMAGKD
ncbi:MAG: J domain-containing protein [Dermatophilus congolensis]|nr:J domain-containing protein [Dermatophilus congolensis]